MDSKNLMADLPLLLVMSMASIHLVNLSTATRRKTWPPFEDLGSMPIMSRPHWRRATPVVWVLARILFRAACPRTSDRHCTFGRCPWHRSWLLDSRIQLVELWRPGCDWLHDGRICP